MNDQEKSVLVCLRANTPVRFVHSSRTFECSMCGHDIKASPASLMAAGHDAVLLCNECADGLSVRLGVDRAGRIDATKYQPTEAQIREIKQHAQ